jgi:hypothetical protein
LVLAYGNNIVLAEFNRETHEIKGLDFIENAHSDDSISLKNY